MATKRPDRISKYKTIKYVFQSTVRKNEQIWNHGTCFCTIKQDVVDNQTYFPCMTKFVKSIKSTKTVLIILIGQNTYVPPIRQKSYK